MTRIAIVYFDAGGGHRNAALALQEIIRQKQLPWDVSLVNLQELLDPLDFMRKYTGLRIQDIYNNMLAHGWTLGSPQLMRVLQLTVRMFHRSSVRLLEKYWEQQPADLVVSVVPHFNRALYQSFAQAFPGCPFVTILTDIADYPPHFWIERQEQFFICGSERAVAQARQLGNADSRIWFTSGMILNPKFYNYPQIDRRAERKKLGLDQNRMTALVLFGGQGSRPRMMEIDRQLGRSGLPLQLILICGKNTKLQEELRARESALPRFIEGFTTEIPYYMQLADFFIGKPGPGSVAEALAMRLPVIVERNAWTLPQERYNADWITEKQVGLVVLNFSTITTAVGRLLEPNHFERFRRNAASMENRALFEIPGILKDILEGRPPENHRSPRANAAGVAS